MTITLQQFSRMIPTNKEPDVWYEIAMDLFPKYGITTANRIAGFMAQCGHESADFTVLEENLNYSAKRLRQVFPRYFPTDAVAKLHAGKPEQIANIVYDDANRVNKIGNTQPGDGWRFRGGGIKQLTGRSNYAAFGRSIGRTAEDAADYVRTKRGAMESALWFWSTNGLNAFADKDDIVGMSKRVNGGNIGLADRKRRYANAKAILSAQSVSQPSAPQRQVSGTSAVPTLRRGSSETEEIKRLQTALRLSPVDGIFGIRTDSAVRNWQRANKFQVTGVVTPDQFSRIVGK